MRENREFFISDDGIRLHLKLDFPRENGGESIGKGRGAFSAQTEEAEKLPLMILVHGFTGDMEERHITAVQRTANEEGFAVLRAEMYGHGRSGGEFRDHTLMKWIGNILTVIDYARTLDFVSDLYLCGHSQTSLPASSSTTMISPS